MTTSNFDHGLGYVWQSVEVQGLPETISVEGITLYSKTAFHVSLVYVQNLLAEHPNLEMEVFNSLMEFNRKYPVSFLRYTGEFRFAQDGDRKSLVALCEVSNLAEFRDHLKVEFNIDIAPQPTHVTIYTLEKGGHGIGLNSPSEMESKSIPVEAPKIVKDALTLLHL